MANELIIYNTQELLRILPQDLIMIKAVGNYTDFYIVGCEVRSMGYQLGQIEQAIREQLGAEAPSFIRIGRSYIINRKYIHYINPRKQLLVMKDYTNKKYHLEKKISEEALRKLMNAIVEGTERRSSDE